MPTVSRLAGILGLLFTTYCSLLAGTLVGRVYSEEGRPVDGVLVSVQPTQATASGLPRSQSVTDVQGTFTVDVADGQYSVCVLSDSKGLLNSCEWSLDQSIVTVVSPFTQFKITLKRGVTLRIRLNDPAKLVSTAVSAPAALAAAASSINASVSFIVWDALGHSHYVREVGGDDNGRNLELLVPSNASIRLSVQNHNVEVLDTTGVSASKTSVAMVASVSAFGDTRVYQAVPASVGVGKAVK